MIEKSNLKSTRRDSNLEMFRCITMLLIVAHHYVVNSGLLAPNGPVCEKSCSWRSLFILVLGAWGKTGINCFVLITGYYMCKSTITARKYFRLLAEIYFYRISLTIIFVMFGLLPITMGKLKILKLILPFWDIDRGFTPCFLLFFLFIPFLTLLVQNMTARQHIYLTLLCLLIYTIVEPLPWTRVPMHYVSWFMVLFLIASFMRLHMGKYMEQDNSIWTMGGGILLIIVDVLSIVMVACLSWHLSLQSHWEYYFVGESNRLLPVLTAIMAFIVFKKMRLPYIPIINLIGASTFGVFLIHANSTMRRWLWCTLLHNVEIYNSPWLVIHSVGSVLGIFFVCVIIDRLRIRFVEPYMMASFDKIWPFFVKWFNYFEKWLVKRTSFLIG